MGFDWLGVIVGGRNWFGFGIRAGNHLVLVLGWLFSGPDSELQILFRSQKWRSFLQNRNRLLVRRWCSGHLLFSSCDSAGSSFDSENSSQHAVAISGNAPSARRAVCTSLGHGLNYPSLRSESSQAAKRRAEAVYVVFFSIKRPSPARWAAALSAFSCIYIRSHERRALGALPVLFRSEPASTDR